MNARAERFNRTIQECFVNHEDLLFTDLAAFNKSLSAGWPCQIQNLAEHRKKAPDQFMIVFFNGIHPIRQSATKIVRDSNELSPASS